MMTIKLCDKPPLVLIGNRGPHLISLMTYLYYVALINIMLVSIRYTMFKKYLKRSACVSEELHEGKEFLKSGLYLRF